MTRPPTPLSPRSSRSWPPLEFELRGSRRLAAGWGLWSLALAASLLLGCSGPLAARGLLAGVALALGTAGVRRFLDRSASGIVRVTWEADGRWRLQQRGGQVDYVQSAVPRRLGALLWLHWRTPAGRRSLLIDGAVMEPNARRRLQARLTLTGPAPRGGRVA